MLHLNSRIVLVGALVLISILSFAVFPGSVLAEQNIRIFINGKEIIPEVSPVIINNRTMVPLRAISEGLGAKVDWQAAERRVVISSDDPAGSLINQDLSIIGESSANAEDLRSLLKKNNPSAPDLVDLYLTIGMEYGVRGDIAFCQAAKETGWWKFGGLVQPGQNNYCGLGATGSPATGQEDLHGADATRVHYVAGQHGAFFATPADGVEAQIQHLYAYASRKALPAGKTIVDPRFTLVSRGIASTWTGLNGRWAVPGDGYGETILNNYYKKALLIRAEQSIRIFINGQESLPDVPPEIINDRTMVPLRAISEGLGAQVQWQANNRKVVITS